MTRRGLVVGGALLGLFSCKLAGSTTALILTTLFVVVFVVVATCHGRVRESINRIALMLKIKRVQMARINLDWEHLPRSDQTAPDPEHPFATDLDITGERSLHRLLDSAVTKEGSRRLRSWLLNNEPDPRIIEQRQSLIKEFSALSLFRDKLHLHAAIAGRNSRTQSRGLTPQGSQIDQWDSHSLVAWIEQGVTRTSLRATVIVLAMLAVLNLTLLILAVLEIVPHVWPIVFLIYIGVSIAKFARTANAWGEVQDLEKALRRFRAVFQYLESRGYGSHPGLAQVCAPFADGRKRPSAELRRVERIAAALGVRTNAPVWFLLNALIPWDFFFTYRLEKLRQEIGQLMPRWLDAWYELEALNSLANFAWLNPDYSYPEVATNSIGCEAKAIGHPLIKPDHKICNDLELDEQHRIIILTGSNMAGKSTFLRTLGVNLCLAYAGAPVNAERMHTSLFRIFTCIKVSDSVQDGLSYFYAEVKRLKLLLSAAEADADLPIMFLIDEIFRGTNNRERHLGSHAFIKALSMRRNALGLIATHDLELTNLADEIPGISNFHFREEISDGQMVFDYELRSGPCPTTNALEIMRIEGLPVDG
jgi:ABC-type branched-subunit amino acid transport system ATPase component